MKKYLIFVGLLLSVIGLSYYCCDIDGRLYLPVSNQSVIRTVFYTKDKRIYDQKGSPYLIKGVDVESSIAGYRQRDLSVDEKTYYRWFKQIAAMGANTIRVRVIMPVTFYHALSRYNDRASHPLYLLQGFRIDAYHDNSSISALDKAYLGTLLREARASVDVIHGRKRIWHSDLGLQHYDQDMSKWLLGYIVGDDWYSGTIAYTNHQNHAKPVGFKGRYYATTPQANRFEAILAEIMEEITSYESRKYGWQHLVSFSNTPQSDPFVYQDPFASQAAKYVQLTIENIKPSAKVKAGLFASYKLLDCHSAYRDYLLFDRLGLDDRLVGDIKRMPLYQGYVKLLTSYHRVPVVVTGYGYSTARGVDQMISTSSPLTEKDQGERLMADYTAFIASGCCGATIHSWQDDWTARSWNTSFATNRHQGFLWGDVQSKAQGYGLLTFEHAPRTHAIDGQKAAGEWSRALTYRKNGQQLLVDQDEKYLYIAIESTKKQPLQRQWFIPLDITPKTGSRVIEGFSARFDRFADFALVVDDHKGSRLLVQERYHATDANYLRQINGKDFYVFPPNKHTPRFTMVDMVMRNDGIFAAIDQVPIAKRGLKRYPTGQLKKGNGNRGSAHFDSQTDISFGERLIELRLPWQLLNFSDPASNKIHDDYFEHYGVEELAIEAIAIGFAPLKESKVIAMVEYPLLSWERPRVREVLKTSYQQVQAVWQEKRRR
ncbi:TPA: hypothetical protein TU245_000228 [Streptococcus equi subsp. zooepidemicus]|uniref:hypothetical protein n=1 Tax=Streptococcus equi TaxID=1336 RepID=UPI001E3855D7|nr:hypothetical protein [Streptococcus equi]MCD3373054.1 hypothetical protein [Streptococcus equi subsp. zooepidemicus]HEL0577193.1 hypothetical protein [Streptococcus equi subsp. zooepidemicus]HEL0794136.1 hypothetical protein [Streptococcus equi subsp. zooepidemicus]